MTSAARCSVLGCAAPARGPLEAQHLEGVLVPAHECRFCREHRCEMEQHVLRRARAGR